MKKYYQLLLVAIILLLMVSCKKDTSPISTDQTEPPFIWVKDSTLIPEMVAQVDSNRIWDNMLHLTSYPSRSNYSIHIEEAADWLYQYMENLGFEVEFNPYLWEDHHLIFSSPTHGIIRNEFEPENKTIVTFDGGNNWQLRTMPEGHTFFLNENVGFVSKEGEYFKATNDGGITWETRDNTFGGRIIHFINENFGWAIAGIGLFKTTDGGYTWQRIQVNNESVYALSILDSSNIWVGIRSGVAHSADGGQTWNLKYIGTPIGYIYMFNNQSGIVKKTNRDVYFTSDSGSTWTKSLESSGFAYGVQPNHLWAGSRGKLYKSNDKGITWKPIFDLDYDVDFMVFTDSLKGWFSTNFGIFKTSDGGYSWNYQIESFPLEFTFENVVATLPGKLEPEKEIILCGHFDTVGSVGADDNSSGVSALLEMADIFSKSNFGYTIKIIFFSTEEISIGGSRHYSWEAAQRSDDIIAVLNFDAIGYWVAGLERDLDVEYNSSSEWLADEIINAANIYTQTSVSKHVPYWGSPPDHRAFWGYGYSAVWLDEAGDLTEMNPFMNSSSDILEHINKPFLIDNIIAGVAASAKLLKPVKKY
jgi:photosystem II stability/assembly factor-like uncharacterized protein